MEPNQDTSQIFDTQKAIEHAIETSKSDWKQTIAMVLTVIAMAVGASLWASNAHADIKDWTSEQDFVTKKELVDIIKEQYVKKEQFAIVRQKLISHEKQHEQLLRTLEKMDLKLDRLESNNKSR